MHGLVYLLLIASVILMTVNKAIKKKTERLKYSLHFHQEK